MLLAYAAGAKQVTPKWRARAVADYEDLFSSANQSVPAVRLSEGPRKDNSGSPN